jgi:hypothetical protein
MGTVEPRPGAAWERTGIVAVDRAALHWQHASMLPRHYRDEAGNARMADVALACLVLYELGVSPTGSLADTFVVGGRVGFQGRLLTALAHRAGYDLEEVSSTPEAATWRIRSEGEAWRPPHTVTMEMARRAGWPQRNQSYEKMPEIMLGWRAITWLIDRYAPGVRLGIDVRRSVVDWDEAGDEVVPAEVIDDAPEASDYEPVEDAE